MPARSHSRLPALLTWLTMLLHRVECSGSAVLGTEFLHEDEQPQTSDGGADLDDSIATGQAAEEGADAGEGRLRAEQQHEQGKAGEQADVNELGHGCGSLLGG